MPKILMMRGYETRPSLCVYICVYVRGNGSRYLVFEGMSSLIRVTSSNLFSEDVNFRPLQCQDLG